MEEEKSAKEAEKITYRRKSGTCHADELIVDLNLIKKRESSPVKKSG
ncbi:MAG: hypothetical protein V8S95_01720 [Odoribacter sp.]